MNDATQRFSSRVENYIKYRPNYPKEIIDYLRKNCRLTSASTIADIGSGTGILTELFLQNGNLVYGIEPNKEMREAGEHFLKYTTFKSIPATAEKTTLAYHSIDLIVAGQAFHWFDRETAKAEFKRILKPKGWIVLIWNERQTDTTPFLKSYEQLLKTYGIDYQQVNHQQIDEIVLSSFFGRQKLKKVSFKNSQIFDFTSLKGRLLSSSYVPEAGHTNYQPMLSELQKIFDKHQEKATVTFNYNTNVYCGQLA